MHDATRAEHRRRAGRLRLRCRLVELLGVVIVLAVVLAGVLVLDVDRLRRRLVELLGLGLGGAGTSPKSAGVRPGWLSPV